ncbi:MAG: hypothetical protein HXX09_07235 [Bacteroidetes bacterium]|nr:hypothetical protein [Bacteroidota bacterium]
MYFGLLLGFLIPLILFGIFYLLNLIYGVWIKGANKEVSIIQMSTIELVSIAGNLLPFRYYMVKLKFDKTGRGMLVMTMVYAVIYIILNHFS